MTFKIIDNREEQMVRAICEVIEASREIDIAVGYFYDTGYKRIAKKIKELLWRGGRVRLIIGSMPHQATAATLKALWKLKEEYKLDTQIKVVNEGFLHSKLYIGKNNNIRIIHGSSNITVGGLEANTEFNTLDIVESDDKRAVETSKWFDSLWESARPFTEDIIEYYTSIIRPEYEIKLEKPEELKPEILLTKEIEGEILKRLKKDGIKGVDVIKRLKEGICDPRDYTVRYFANRLKHGFEIPANVVPFEYQLNAAYEIVDKFKHDFKGMMIAHDVGLGKTIISGIALKELLNQNLAKKILILSPASLTEEVWESELEKKFNEDFVVVDRDNFENGRAWKRYNKIITSIDFARENKDTLNEIAWDVVVIDEAHMLRNPNTERYKLVNNILQPRKFTLLLTATPIHNTIYDIYHEMELIDNYLERKHFKIYGEAVDLKALNEVYEGAIIRKLRRDVEELNKLIPDRKVLAERVGMEKFEGENYKKLENYIKNSHYYALLKRSNPGLSVLYIYTFLKQLASSPYAVTQRLHTIIGDIKEGLGTGKIILEKKIKRIEEETEEEIESKITEINLFESDKKKLEEELKSVKGYLKVLKKIKISSKEKRIKGILDKINGKPVIFTEYVSTGEHLVKILEEKKLKVGFYHGGLNKTERKNLIKDFRKKLDVLVSTEAGGQGLNLQFANSVINNDLSWNPMRIEQRIGRVHRFGQKKRVGVYNLLLKGTLEEKIYEILEEKIGIIGKTVGLSDPVVGQFGTVEMVVKRFFSDGIDEKKVGEEVEKALKEPRKIEQKLLSGFSKEIMRIFRGITQKDLETQGNMTEILVKDFIKRFNVDHKWVNDKILEINHNGKHRITWDLQTARENEAEVEYLARGHDLLKEIINIYTENGFGIVSGKKITRNGIQFNLRIVLKKGKEIQEIMYPVFVETQTRIGDINDKVNFEEFEKLKEIKGEEILKALEKTIKKVNNFLKEKKERKHESKLVKQYFTSLIKRNRIKIEDIEKEIKEFLKRKERLERTSAEPERIKEYEKKIKEIEKKIDKLEKKKANIAKELRRSVGLKSKKLKKSTYTVAEKKELDSICVFVKE